MAGSAPLAMQIGELGSMALAMSPLPTSSPGGGGQVPSGMSPNAKRPLDRESVRVANTGVRGMSSEDLSAGFLALSDKFEKVAHAVQFNADLLNSVIT